MKATIRYMLVVPAAVGALIAAQTVLALLAWLPFGSDDWWYQLTSSVLPFGCFVIAGTFTAPGHKVGVARALASLVIIGFTVIIAATIHRGTMPSKSLIWLIVCAIISSSTAFGVAHSVAEQVAEDAQGEEISRPPTHPTHPINYN